MYLALIGLLLGAALTHAQNLTGKVIDEKNEPLAYANVILQTEDSVFLAGQPPIGKGSLNLSCTKRQNI